MSQSSFGDEDLFGEAADEMRTDVEESLAAAREGLPGSEDIWEVEANNTLGVLNTLSQALDPDDAADHLHDAKKWYAMGERADAFEDADDLAAEIEALDAVVETIEGAHEHANDLSTMIPELRGDLDDAHEAAGESESDENEE